MTGMSRPILSSLTSSASSRCFKPVLESTSRACSTTLVSSRISSDDFCSSPRRSGANCSSKFFCKALTSLVSSVGCDLSSWCRSPSTSASCFMAAASTAATRASARLLRDSSSCRRLSAHWSRNSTLERSCRSLSKESRKSLSFSCISLIERSRASTLEPSGDCPAPP